MLMVLSQARGMVFFKERLGSLSYIKPVQDSLNSVTPGVLVQKKKNEQR